MLLDPFDQLPHLAAVPRRHGQQRSSGSIVHQDVSEGIHDEYRRIAKPVTREETDGVAGQVGTGERGERRIEAFAPVTTEVRVSNTQSGPWAREQSIRGEFSQSAVVHGREQALQEDPPVRWDLRACSPSAGDRSARTREMLGAECAVGRRHRARMECSEMQIITVGHDWASTLAASSWCLSSTNTKRGTKRSASHSKSPLPSSKSFSWKWRVAPREVDLV